MKHFKDFIEIDTNMEEIKLSIALYKNVYESYSRIIKPDNKRLIKHMRDDLIFWKNNLNFVIDIVLGIA